MTYDTTAELEREVEVSRDRIERTVDALKDKMSFGQLVDEVLDYARAHGGEEMASNLAGQVRSNPLPLALVGVGIAWLMFGPTVPISAKRSGTWSRPDWRNGEASADGDFWGAEGSGSYRGNGMETPEAGTGVGATIGKAGSAVRSAAASAGEAISATTHRVGEMAEDATGKLRATFHDASDAASRAMHSAAGTVTGMAKGGASMGRRVASTFADEPLVLGAVGLAAGAALGVALPATEAEDKMFGGARDRLMGEAGGIAREQYEKAKEAAADLYQSAKGEVMASGEPEDRRNEAEPQPGL